MYSIRWCPDSLRWLVVKDEGDLEAIVCSRHQKESDARESAQRLAAAEGG